MIAWEDGKSHWGGGGEIWYDEGVERRERKKLKREKVGRVNGGRIFVGLMVVGVVGYGGWWVVDFAGSFSGVEEELEVREPAVVIVDENAGNAVSERVKELVMRLEDDLAYEGYEISRVVMPFARTRQIDVYLDGRGEYYKVSVDRGAAESAEDIGRMVRYLDERELSVQYVDIRVTRKAFYK